jgi:3-methyladenine DNA glycosylase AlkD
MKNSNILKEIESKKDKKKAKILAGFFKTGAGQYGEGDIFWGLTVPVSRKIVKKHENISKTEIASLLKSKVHEVRLIALFILVFQYKKSSTKQKKEIVDFYLKNTKYINNWDLVDLSAPSILGDYLTNNGNKNILLKLTKSKNLWEQRIAIVATYSLIKKGELWYTFKIAKIFFKHDHDLIHKATGWMLREAGKKDEKALREFLDNNFSQMPRTMLRYAIEKFREDVRLMYLKK